MSLHGTEYNLLIFDTAGQETYESIRKTMVYTLDIDAQWTKTLKNHKVGSKWYNILSRAKIMFVYVYKPSCDTEKNYADRKKFN